MAKAFPTDNPFLRGYYAPVNTEADAAHLHISGEMPAGLLGTLYRNGPNPQFAPRGPYHWFGGDGMIHAFHIENGNVSYKNRWVRTPKWEIENKDVARPSAEKLAQIAAALETTADYLLEGDGAKEEDEATDLAFYRKYKKLDAPVKERLRKMLDILDDD